MAKALYRLAERFHSIQGEGTHAGVQMHFIRLAGCNVGKFMAPALLRSESEFSILDPEQRSRTRVLAMERERYPNYSVCQTALGQRFLCDTVYNRVVESMDADQIISDTFEQHICVTGGEPFLSDLTELLVAAYAAEVCVHIETSGTLPIKGRIPEHVLDHVWVTCSPKAGFLHSNADQIDEYKFVISKDQGMDVVNQITRFMVELNLSSDYLKPAVFIQPVNGINTVDRIELEFVTKVLRENPEWRLSCQLHKLLGLQ